MIAIIDYGMGNLRSVSKALEKFGAEVTVTQDAQILGQADKIILPGVGAFGDALCELRKRNLIKPIRENISKGKPFLGICLGLQLLFTSSEENPGVPGLNIFRGTVVKFPSGSGEHTLKVPHMGWNLVSLREKNPGGLLQGIKNDSYFYFVHSYFALPENPELIMGSSEYGTMFPAIIGKENVWATQFHPEKSQEEGLKILANFVAM
ncbi:MAG: imidazole glycerol phosphate synthase subunit HisH [Candidatus Omnitrophica bacterium]|nr:imidazole glycerol phosphate synthase subunit HisH [Candidatus Omnitrophota bacterium]